MVERLVKEVSWACWALTWSANVCDWARSFQFQAGSISTGSCAISRQRASLAPTPLRHSAQELDWFYDLLATAVEGPAKVGKIRRPQGTCATSH